MTGRLEVSFCEACPCWPDSAEAWGKTEVAPIPAATLPTTEVFTKSRREKVTDPPEKSGLIYTEVTRVASVSRLRTSKNLHHGGHRGTQECGRISRALGRLQVREACLVSAEMAAPRGEQPVSRRTVLFSTGAHTAASVPDTRLRLSPDRQQQRC